MPEPKRAAQAPPTHYLIPVDLLQATLDYLSKRPFVEVAEAVLALRSLQPHEPLATTD
jgi:hypothetical protein